jgi:hypothetical protein
VVELTPPVPQVPHPGDVCLVSSVIRNPYDPKPFRPAVVVQVPATINGRIVIITRTTDLEVYPGLYSPPDPNLKLTEEGIWSRRETVEARLWLPPDVVPLGQVDAIELADIARELRIDWSAS